MVELTAEQLQVINHPDGVHAKVLSVAGSGKTTTMVYRIKHLLEEKQIGPRQIQVLMFNNLAKDQFVEKLSDAGMLQGQMPPVNTFHSYAYRLINSQGFHQWFGDKEELAHLELVKAVSQVRRDLELNENDLDVDDAEQAIGLWKGALIPPSQAGYAAYNGEAYVEVYKAFEQSRLESNAITFDDFVPLSITMLNNDSHLRRQKTGGLKYIIVDEYQDVNLGQQMLIEILAGSGADLMVIGDDDQTIYEWRGARSDYILGEFQNTFANKPHRTYNLTHSFRFGYDIAQSSYNVILHNSNRLIKPVVSDDPASDSQVTLITDKGGTGDSANRQLAEEILGLVKSKGVKPPDIRVLARTYAQLNSFSTELMIKEIPFKVVGRVPFFNGGECKALLDYVRVAYRLHRVPNRDITDRFVNIANKPSRYLARRDVQRMLSNGRESGLTLSVLLYNTTQDAKAFRYERQRDRLEDLTSVLEDIRTKLDSKEPALAGPLLEWLEQEVGLQQHYENYYGRGEASLTRMEAIRTLIAYAHQVKLDWKDFIAHIENFDTTLGRPEHEWIKMMTIHRAKGLEFDYVIIPDCVEGYMPIIGSNDDPTYDTRHPRRTPKAAEWIESERRLFYVSATRARKELFIGAPKLAETSGERQGAARNSSRFLEELELEPTQAVGTELRLAARGERNRLVEVCRQFSTYHHIITPVKEIYIRKLHLPNLVRRLARVVLSSAARVFGYRQKYDSPFERTSTVPRLGDRNKTDDDGEVWGHMGKDRRRIRNWYEDDETDLPF